MESSLNLLATGIQQHAFTVHDPYIFAQDIGTGKCLVAGNSGAHPAEGAPHPGASPGGALLTDPPERLPHRSPPRRERDRRGPSTDASLVVSDRQTAESRYLVRESETVCVIITNHSNTVTGSGPKIQN
jgi:hypothetical protein